MDNYTKFILSVIALGLWALVFVSFLQPTAVEAQYDVQKVEVVRWSVYPPVEVDLKKIDGNKSLGALGWGLMTPSIPVTIED